MRRFAITFGVSNAVRVTEDAAEQMLGAPVELSRMADLLRREVDRDSRRVYRDAAPSAVSSAAVTL